MPTSMSCGWRCSGSQGGDLKALGQVEWIDPKHCNAGYLLGAARAQRQIEVIIP